MESLAVAEAQPNLFKQLAYSCGIETYVSLKDDIRPNDNSNGGFQKRFARFYGISRARNEKWKSEYFSVFAKMLEKKNRKEEVTFEEILQCFSHEEHIKAKCEASFASKMLAMLNPEKPIIDRHVRDFFNFSITGKTVEERVRVAIEAYKGLEKWYADYLGTEAAKECIVLFDSHFPDYAGKITAVKKIDFLLLWRGRHKNR